MHMKIPPIPEAIVQLLNPVYACLGARGLLEKCVHWYTQNANESLHSVVWKHVPKVLHTDKAAVEKECTLAVCSWNDGVFFLWHRRRGRGRGGLEVVVHLRRGRCREYFC